MGIFGRLFGKPADEGEEMLITDNDECDEDDEYEGERLNVYAAADIYFSAGMDEDQMFGYSHEELQKAFDA